VRDGQTTLRLPDVENIEDVILDGQSVSFEEKLILAKGNHNIRVQFGARNYEKELRG
jgi:hypothetical protein